MHYAARSGNPAILQHLLHEYPQLTKKAWIRNQDGDFPNAFAPVSMTPKPYQILDEALLEATNRVIDHVAKPNDLILLASFQDEWRALLINKEGVNIQEMIAQIACFSAPLQTILQFLLPTLSIKNFSFTDSVVKKVQLKHLIDLLPPNNKQSNAILTETLTRFCQQCQEDALNTEETRCLQLITEDYARGLLGHHTSMTDLAIKKLSCSMTLDQFKPKPVNTQELDINPGNFGTYLETFRERVGRLALNQDESRIMQTVMLPGLEKLITQEDAIVEHAVNHFGVLYYLDNEEKLPLHTDHTPIANCEEYRKTLHRLLANFFGAADIAHRAARLNEFCGKITHGYCFEGRVRDAFTWAAAFSELVSFHTLMERYTEEYLAYAHVMLAQTDAQLSFIEPACAFIIERHQDMPCILEAHYAPNATVTKHGVANYLKNVLLYDSKHPILEIETLILSLQNECKQFWNLSFWSERSRNSNLIQIKALTALKQVWEQAFAKTEKPSRKDVLAIKREYSNSVFNQHTNALFDNAERAGEAETEDGLEPNISVNAGKMK